MNFIKNYGLYILAILIVIVIYVSIPSIPTPPTLQCDVESQKDCDLLIQKNTSDWEKLESQQSLLSRKNDVYRAVKAVNSTGVFTQTIL